MIKRSIPSASDFWIARLPIFLFDKIPLAPDLSLVSFASRFADPAALQTPLLRRFEALLAPTSAAGLEQLAQRSAALARRHFGRTMRLFAPLYVSNECTNGCIYCGFNRENLL